MSEKFYNIRMEDGVFITQKSPEHCKMYTNSPEGIHLAMSVYAGEDVEISPEAAEVLRSLGYEIVE